MRPTTDLLTLEFVFSQRSLLTPKDFLKEYKRRVLHSDSSLSFWEQLDALHRAEALVPLYEAVKHVESILANARQSDQPLSTVVAQHLSRGSVFDKVLHEYPSLGYLQDPRTKQYQPWSDYIIDVEGRKCWTSTFLYSPYQLLLVPTLRTLVSRMRSHRDSQRDVSVGRFELELDEHTRTRIRENTDLVFVLTALETKYLPQLRGHWNRAQYRGDLDAILEYQRSFDPSTTLNWIRWDAKKVLSTAERLLMLADSIDPLRDWTQLVRLCHPNKWEKLRGDALVASDHRIAAEILLRFYEDLIRVDVALPFEPIPKFARGPRDTRLLGDPSQLDEVLMEFGISPQPSLVLILEGDTEWIIVPRVMELLGIPRHSSFIELFKGKGTGTDFGLLATYIAVPKLGEALQDSIILTRPPTKFLVAIDAEDKFITPQKCDREREKWVSQIFDAISFEYHTPVLRDQVDTLVELETWGRQNFEFAHFTDEEIAQATLRVYKDHEGSIAYLLSKLKVKFETQLLAKLKRIVSKTRPNGDIYKLSEGWNYRPRKPAVAEVLWPVLREKVEEAAELDTLDTVPVARVLLHAWELAAKLPRENVVIPHQNQNTK